MSRNPFRLIFAALARVLGQPVYFLAFFDHVVSNVFGASSCLCFFLHAIDFNTVFEADVVKHIFHFFVSLIVTHLETHAINVFLALFDSLVSKHGEFGFALVVYEGVIQVIECVAIISAVFFLRVINIFD